MRPSNAGGRVSHTPIAVARGGENRCAMLHCDRARRRDMIALSTAGIPRDQAIRADRVEVWTKVWYGR